jgi:large subunit ribosomal protein L15
MAEDTKKAKKADVDEVTAEETPVEEAPPKAPKKAKAADDAAPAEVKAEEEAEVKAKVKAEEATPSPAKPAKAKAAPKAKAEEATPSSDKPRIVKVHHLRPAPGAKKAKTRVGRGEASKGKTAGRGTKGSKARGTVPARLEGGQMPLHMRLPKLRGFTNRFRTEYQVVNVGKIAELFPQGGAVGVADLVEAGAVRKGCLVKVLGTGDIAVKVEVTVDAWSASAHEKITAAGGTIGS